MQSRYQIPTKQKGKTAIMLIFPFMKIYNKFKNLFSQKIPEYMEKCE